MDPQTEDNGHHGPGRDQHKRRLKEKQQGEMQILQKIKNYFCGGQLGPSLFSWGYLILKEQLCLLIGSEIDNMYLFMSKILSVLEKDWNKSKRCKSTAKFCQD